MLRQLNAYGFRRIDDHVASGRLEYFHENFISGRRDLLVNIQRSGSQVWEKLAEAKMAAKTSPGEGGRTTV